MVDNGKINLTESFFNQMLELCMSDEYSDIAFIVENERIPAHKFILTVRSEYFRALLSGGLQESNQKEIHLKEIPLEAFKAILRYIYTGQLCLSELKEENITEIVIIADQYGFTELKIAIAEYLKTVVSLENVCAIFHVARLCKLKELKEVCLTFMDLNAFNILRHKSLTELPKESLEVVLRRDSFLASEFDIFVAVKEWHGHNPNENADIIFSCIRLPLINFDKHMKDLRQCEFFDSEKLLNAIEMRAAPELLPYRVCPDENIVAKNFGMKIRKGEWVNPSSDISLDDYDLNNVEVPPLHGLGGEIVIELGVATLINYIEIQLLKMESTFSYSVEFSENQLCWERVVDFRNYHCSSLQRLHFPTKITKFIKLEGNHKQNFGISGMKAIYQTTPGPKIIHGFTCATVDIWGGDALQKGPILIPGGDCYGRDSQIIKKT